MSKNEKNNNNETELNSIFEISKNIFIPQAESHYGLNNQIEIIKYNDSNNLLIYINNSNDFNIKIN